jgi:hypothetical protein
MLTFTQNSTCPFEVGFVLLREREREREKEERRPGRPGWMFTSFVSCVLLKFGSGIPPGMGCLQIGKRTFH